MVRQRHDRRCSSILVVVLLLVISVQPLTVGARPFAQTSTPTPCLLQVGPDPQPGLGYPGVLIRRMPTRTSAPVTVGTSTHIPWETGVPVDQRFRDGTEEWYHVTNLNGVSGWTGWVAAQTTGVTFGTLAPCSQPLPDAITDAQYQALQLPCTTTAIAQLLTESDARVMARVAFAEASVYGSLVPDPRGTGFPPTASGGVVDMDVTNVLWLIRLRAFIGLAEYATGTAGQTVTIKREIFRDLVNNTGTALNPNPAGYTNYEPITVLWNGTPCALGTNVQRMLQPTRAEAVRLLEIETEAQTILHVGWSQFPNGQNSPTNLRGYEEFRGIQAPEPCRGDGGTLLTRPDNAGIWRQRYGSSQPYPPNEVLQLHVPEAAFITCYRDSYHLDDWFFANLSSHPSWDTRQTFPQTFRVGAMDDCAGSRYPLAQLPFGDGVFPEDVRCPTSSASGSAYAGFNHLSFQFSNWIPGSHVSIDKQQRTGVSTITAATSGHPMEVAHAANWFEWLWFFINQSTYEYDDTQIDAVSTYCYRARTAFLGIPLGTSNEVCLAPAQPPYPYGIQTVTTEPSAYQGHRDLPVLFDGITEHPNYGIISFTPGPIAVVLTFAQPVTLDAFATAIGGQTGNPNGYRWKVEADPTGTGAYQTVIAAQYSDAERVNLPFASPVTATVFRITHERFTGDGVEHIREITPIVVAPHATGQISGGVFVESATPAYALADAFVEVCVIGGACRTATTNSAGQYTVTGLGAGSYYITAFPPAGAHMQPERSDPLTLTSGATLSGQNLILRSPTPPPAGTTITQRDTTVDGVPIVYWAAPLTLRTTSCAGGSARYTLTQDGISKRSGALTEGPATIYTAQIAPLQPMHGPARLTITIRCPGGATQTRAFDLYIDPSGFVRTVEGTPIAGATVTLYRADRPEGPFTVVPNGSALMSPKNRTNPDLTDSDGHFGWDVLAGFYKVRAEKVGCTAPHDPSQGYVESAVYPIPPPVIDVDLRLACGTLPPAEKMSPILECVAENGDGTYTAYFGYRNPNAFVVTIPIGANNKLTPSPPNRGQATVFQPGRTPAYPNAAFSVPFPGGNLVWTLNGRTSTASPASKRCAVTPSVGDTRP